MAQSHEFVAKVQAEGRRAYEQAVMTEALDAAKYDAVSYEVDTAGIAQGEPLVFTLKYADGSYVDLEVTAMSPKPVKAFVQN